MIRRYSSRSNLGFSLLEVLIALGILGTLSILVATSIQRGVRNKSNIQAQLDDLSQIRSALKVMETDINQAFHYRDFEKEFLEEVKKVGTPGTTTPPAGTPGAGTPAAGTPGAGVPAAGTNPQQPTTDLGSTTPREVPRISPVTHFVGENEKLNFVTKNVQRTAADSRIADFQEVGYVLKECDSFTGEGRAGSCIWRRSSPYVDSDVERGGEEMVLLDNVSEFKLRYFGKGKQDWVTQWKSTQAGDAVTTGNFPQGVEISLTYERIVENKKPKKYSMQIVVPLRFPNNPEKKATP